MKIVTFLLVVVVLLLGALFYMGVQYKPSITSYTIEQPLGAIQPTNAGLGLNRTATVTTTVSKAFSAATYLQYRRISNIGAFDVVISGTSTGLDASTGAGIFIKASSSVTFSGDSLYTGDIYADGLGTTILSEGGL